MKKNTYRFYLDNGETLLLRGRMTSNDEEYFVHVSDYSEAVLQKSHVLYYMVDKDRLA